MISIATVYRDGRPFALDLEDTVGITLPDTETVTRRIVPPPRRPDASGEPPQYRPSRSFASFVDAPCATGELPAFVQAAMSRPYQPTVAERREHVGRHRARPGLFARLARLFGRGRRDGA
jgi:hypothetical protein